MAREEVEQYIENFIYENRKGAQPIGILEDYYLIRTRMPDATIESLSKQMKFSKNLTGQLFSTVVGFVIIVAGYLVIRDNLLIQLLGQFIISIGFFSIIGIWFISNGDKLTLSDEGILFNDTFLSWKSIESTDIVYLGTDSKIPLNQSFLVIGTATGRIRLFELTRLQFTSKSLTNKREDLVKFGHHIECYKKRAVSEKSS